VPRLRALATTALSGGRAILLVGALVLAVDQLTKHWATDTLAHNPYGGPSLFDGLITLTYATNTGAAFGVLTDRGILFLLIGLVVAGVLIAGWRLLPRQRLLVRLSLGLQLGGAAGNLLDRVREGHVIDFILLPHWPVFNLADSAIVCGVVLLIYHLLVVPPKPASGNPRATRDPVP